MAKLYEISERYQNLANLLEDEMIDKKLVYEALKGVGDEFFDKALNVARFIKNLEADAKVIKEEKDRLYKLETAYKRKRDWLKDYLEREMKAANVMKINDPVMPITFRKCPPSVSIEEEEIIPNKYKITQAPKVDKQKILDALKQGQRVPGARLVDDRVYLKIG